MNLIFITGDHPRHAFIARTLATTGLLSAIIREHRGHFVPQPPAGLSASLTALFNHHFKLRSEVENTVFGPAIWPEVEILDTSMEALNGPATQALIRRIQPQLLLSYGCHRLDEATLSLAPGDAWNIHGGLSPWYRGAITHFWPSYLLEPQMTGMTVHQLTQQLDAGAMVHQCVAPMVRGDGLHRLAARAVETLATELPQLVTMQHQGQAIQLHHHTTPGKLWLARDWRPEHLKLIYECYEDKIVDAWLDGQLDNRPPELHRQF